MLNKVFAVWLSGKEVPLGKTKDVLTNPENDYTKSLVSSVPPTNRKISRFVIVEKENKDNKENSIKILNRWTKKEIEKQDLIKVKNLNKSFDDNFLLKTQKIQWWQ